tara:strand:+ start:4212 stop:5150 length:939 start_codon:yes stop_codon:yes gene_type:complete
MKNKVLVTGGTGFLGKAVCSELLSSGYSEVVSVGSKDFDLRSQVSVQDMLSQHRPDCVIHLAATVGGIGANKENPGKFMYENLIMGTNLIESCRNFETKKFVMVGTVCAYPKFTEVPFKEEDIWNGYPEETNAPYGVAKKALMQLVQSYHQQYGFNGVNLIPVNMYGPHDNFDPAISHVIPALILKFHQAMENSPNSDVEIWGTGSASREFLYVEDCARAIRISMEEHEDPDPVNIGTNSEINIRELAHKISDLMGYGGNIYFNSSYPDGQPRRCLDTSKAKNMFGFEAQVSLDEGLKRTIEWFRNDYINNF